MSNRQSAAELRRSWIRGVRSEDVDYALNALTWRNEELAAELERSQELVRELSERVLAAEDTLQTFHASFEHVGTMLSLAEQRAEETVATAKAEAARIGAAAEERVRAAEAEVARLTEQQPEPAPAAPAVEEPPRLTVADLLALEQPRF